MLPLLKRFSVAQKIDELPSLTFRTSALAGTLKLALVPVKQSLQDRLGIRGST
jgi:hypothetical protein